MKEGIELSAIRDDNRLPQVYPTLVIGLGGTGIGVLRYLRRRLKEEFGTGVRDEPPLVQLLGVDTVPLENRSAIESLHQHEYAYIGGFNAERVIQNIDRFREIKSWWDWDTESGLPLGYISTGAKQLRTIGRLALYRRFHMFNSRLDAKLNRLASIDAHQFMHQFQLRPTLDQVYLPHVFIVGSLAGGTGSGTFLDIACHLRQRLEDQGRIMGVFVLPSVFDQDIPSLLQQRRIRANAYAALAELEHFQSGNRFETTLPEQPPLRLEGGIFHHVFLVDRYNVSGFQIENQADVQQMIADSIFQVSVSPMAGEVWERDANVSRERTLEGRTLSYSALGYSSLAINGDRRFAELWNRHVDELLTSIYGFAGNYQATSTNQASAIIREISELANANSTGLGDSKADPVAIYQRTMKADIYERISTKITENFETWGFEGTVSFLKQLQDYYDQYPDAAEGQRQSWGQNEQARLERRLDSALKKYNDTQTSVARSTLDSFFNRRGETPQAAAQRAQAEQALNNTKANLDEFRLLREGVAPDLVVLLPRLQQELNDCIAALDELKDTLEIPSVSSPPDYPLRTWLSHNGVPGQTDNSASQEISFEAVDQVAGRLLTQWTRVNPLELHPAIELDPIFAVAAKRDIIVEARQLTVDSTKTRSSLYSVIRHHSNDNREKTYDILRDFIRRCVPFVKLDFDRYNYSEKNIEPIYLLCLPDELNNEYRMESSVFWALGTGEYAFKPTDKPGRDDRADAICISHGYPLSVFADLPQLFNEYISSDLGNTPLHLQCCWRHQIGTIHSATADELWRDDELRKEIRKSCKGRCSENGQGPDGTSPSSTGGSRTSSPPADQKSAWES